MIALDTNVLVRLFVSDNADQATAARGLVARFGDDEGSIHVSLVVLVEFAWVLRARAGWTKSRVLQALDGLACDPRFVLDERDAVETAMLAAETGPADFADYLIAALARDGGATTTYTFDVEAARSAGFTLVPA